MKRALLFLLLCFHLHLQADEERFPRPSFQEVQEASESIEEQGKAEVLSLPYKVLSQFLWDRYVRGPEENFHYYGCNPIELSPDQAKQPATILLHAYGSNQGQWLPLIHSIANYNEQNHSSGPIFSFNYQPGSDLEELIKKIEQVKELYLNTGEQNIEIYLVGHSLGGTCSAEYAFSPEVWVDQTIVKKVISITGRLKNIEPPTDTPFYPFCYDILERIDSIWGQIEQNRGIVELYTIAAENDWLIPEESVLVGDDEDHIAIIPNKGHVLAPYSHATRDLVIQWLFN